MKNNNYIQALAGRTLVLASSSPRRRDILKDAGIPFVVDVADYEEDLSMPLPPNELARHLAYGKAEEVARRHDSALVLSADTIVVLDGKVLGKPVDPQDARRMLALIQGRRHEVVTGFCLIDCRTGRSLTRAVSSHVHIMPLDEDAIANYVATGEPLDKAGSYAAQGIGAQFIERVEGDFLNVVGLPLSEVLLAMQEIA